ncbi:MAG: hypothetical protein UV61_C0033G0003 [Candidatus Gottesmanbacteria bacterium GW2011_GWB1_43_11]|uniref:Uncharacterized protein n=1 Tax=Candidatus Gottesmanbacteria bacterium GW2011_GWB1_43_11 TaxID=1618446 RepID=A0A0G1CFH1_9BACT|nr:MAG: hypothetical protein UV61_C0033G0003 [Candidatus Gottesmanbacteria bacterium GW2011_GWB1_43_11]
MFVNRLLADIDSIVELISFWEKNWPHIWWFPNWYLGVPFRFVSGPVVPVLVLLFRSLTGWAVATSYLALIGMTWLIGGIGVKLLVKELGGAKRQQWWSMVLFWLLPGSFFLLQFGNGLHHISTALLPWVFYFWWKYLKLTHPNPLLRIEGNSLGNEFRFPLFVRGGQGALLNEAWLIFTTLGVTLLLLINSAAILPLVIGLTALILLKSKTEWLAGFIKGILIILTAVSLATIWYTPRFWWIILGNPSFGGKPLSNVIPYILQLAQAFVPIVLGVWFVQKRYRLIQKLTRFGVFFGGSFLFLTLVRFASDPDFWMDWVGYGLELQLAAALLFPLVILNLFQDHKSIRIVTFFIILMLTIGEGVGVYTTYMSYKSYTSYKQRIVELVGGSVSQNDRIFLTGSGVFWLGEFARGQNLLDPQLDRDGTLVNHKGIVPPRMRSSQISPASPRFFEVGLLQVRGGRDEVSTHQTWAMGSYNIREGEKVELLKDWLAVFGVSTLLYQNETSVEYFKDYKNRQRFADMTCYLTCEKPDVIYKFPNSIARLAQKELLQVSPPKAGNDESTLATYTFKLGEPLEFAYIKPNQMIISGETKENEVISLAVAFDPHWKLTTGSGVVNSDNFGNLVITPSQNENEWSLTYQENWSSWMPGIVLSLISLAFLTQTKRMVELLERKTPAIGVIGKNEEDEY